MEKIISKIKAANLHPWLWELFKVLTVGLLIFIALEIIAPRSVLSTLNLSGWLVAWLISGIIVIMTKN